jgi:endonuclease YncB( thermonuclease family)
MVNKSILFVCILNLAALAFLCRRALETPDAPEIPATARPAAHSYPCQLVKVIDGNTVVLHVDLGFNTWLRDLTIHLAGVAAPRQGARGAHDLTALLESETEGRVLELEAQGDGQGSFNRWFGVLYADGENVNARLQEQLARDE